MILWSVFAWKTANFANWLQCWHLLTFIRSKHQLTKLWNSDLFEGIIRIQSEAVGVTWPEFSTLIDHWWISAIFWNLRRWQNICPMLVPHTLNLIFFCYLAISFHICMIMQLSWRLVITFTLITCNLATNRVILQAMQFMLQNAVLNTYVSMVPLSILVF